MTRLFQSHPVYDVQSGPTSTVPWNDRIVRKDAVIGDLRHKVDILYRIDDMDHTPWTSNRSQAEYLKMYRPDLCPPEASEHRLGTIFEYYYYHDHVFTRSYLRHVDELAVPLSASTFVDNTD